MHAETLRATAFITVNLDFFSAPFLNQVEFQGWVANSGQEGNIKNLTDTLYLSLTNPVSYLAEFIDALIGKALGPKDTACLRYGDNQRLIALFEQNRSLTKTIVYLARNPAIKKWNEDHPEIVNKTRKINQLMSALAFFREKSEKMAETGFIDEARLGFQLIDDIKKEMVKLIDAIQDDSNSFYKNCVTYIHQARLQLTNHWDYKQILRHLLFVISDNFNRAFPCLQCNSFFNERSEYITSLGSIEKTACAIKQRNSI
ncbi:hypothetical protein [Legionella maceachernii]|uniref:Uncharacterized protein n=1 Tax=Legionella maceachernii TaxID=466 RepID=A0A0W0VVE5_9GAMM|nr:hypothetical protein [Legionella maceachernii]KTD24040.1 hypothetical protein Lmac_2913 [Legionella maceachernii]SJZ84669.1 hypothetical protein SAMN02745128_01207 [Legionella maceachernii]SUO99280.1 Uncharacterised protein [Legionella maceachernii]